MNYHRKPRPDVFEVLTFARSHVFVRLNSREYLVVSALEHGTSITRWQKGAADASGTRYSARAEDLGLFDGSAWNLPALVKWLAADLRCCPVCGRAVSGRKIYDRTACKQKAYRDRRV